MKFFILINMIEDAIYHNKYYNGYITYWLNVEKNIQITVEIKNIDTYIFNDDFIEIKQKDHRITRIKKDIIEMIQLNTKKTFNKE